MAFYPNNYWPGNTRGAFQDEAEDHEQWHDDVMAEVLAMQAELGLTPSGGAATVRERLDAFGKFESSGEIGPDNAGPTSSTTPLIIDTITVPDQGPGVVHAFANVYISKTVAADRFTLQLRVAGTTINQASEPTAASAVFPFALSGALGVLGGSTTLIEVILVRSVGGGSAQVGVGSQCGLHYIFIPNVV